MRVWDLPLRIFHWALVIAVIGAVGSAKADVMWLMNDLGTIMGLVVFAYFGIFGWLLCAVQPVFNTATRRRWHYNC